MREELLYKNKNINRGYRELKVWQEAVDLYKTEKQKLDSIRIDLKIKSQILDSAFSVSSNIAEGYCRRSLKENIQFLNIAIASLGENFSQITTVTNSDEIDLEWFEKFDLLHSSLENKILKLNRTYIQKLKSGEEWADSY